jgi:hypothetical protein
MADRQGRCTNFGNCTLADKKEILSVPVGADFVCHECDTALVPVGGNGGLGKWRIPIIAGVLVLVLAAAGVFILRGCGDEGPAAEAKFLTQVKAVLEECERTREGISPDKMKVLKSEAERLKLADRADELIQTAKRNYLTDKRTALGTDATPQKLQPLCELARKFGMPTAVQGCTPPTEEILAQLAQGEFAKARELLKIAGDDPQAKKLRDKLETPLTLEASLQYQKKTEAPSAEYPLNAQALKKLVLTNQDNYRLLITASQDEVFLYIFQKDQYGEIKRLFPDPVWSGGVDNPIVRSKKYQMPGEKDWYYLDELPAAQTGTITETLYLCASPWRAKDLEELYGKIHEATSPEDRKGRIENFQKQLQLRNDPSFKSLFFKEFPFEHGKSR